MKVSSKQKAVRSKTHNRKAGTTGIFVCLLLAVLLPRGSTEAQQAMKVPRIGFVTGESPSSISGRAEAFRQGLLVLGYAEGKNIVIEYRYAEGKLERLPALIAELVRLNVDVIVITGFAGAPAAKNATKTIPIVFVGAGDPVGLPAMYGSSNYVDAGGLMPYAANYTDVYRRAATYVDKI
jgi:ABC-type uncharacterized transport system substrate-binding protein